MPNNSETVKFSFVKDEGYRVAPVNGVWGGPTPRGDIWVQFFYETYADPSLVVHQVTEGVLGAPVERTPPDGEYVRTLVFGMMITPEQANVIGQWLIEKARMLKSVRRAQTQAGTTQDEGGT